MTEFNLGDQRLSVSSSLGTEFAESLEKGEGTGVIEQVREHLSQHPGTRIIGFSIEEGKSLDDLRASLLAQMGLPKGFKWGDIRNRFAGSEDSYLMVVLGAGNLSGKERKRLERKTKRFGIKRIIDPKE